MSIDFLRSRFSESADDEAFVWRDEAYTYGWLLDGIDRWAEEFERHGLRRGTVVSIEADFSPRSIALLLALIERGCVIVPLTASVESKKPEFREIAEIETIIGIEDDDSFSIKNTSTQVTHRVLKELIARDRPGLVLFSSGSTGKSKAAVHDLVPMLEKFKLRRHTLRTITFLLFDHIGGFNTLLYCLSNAGCIITVSDRSPETICKTIERHRVELLPTSPTFLNLMLVSGAIANHDLSSLKMVTYGTEVMPETTLKRFHEILPDVKLLQTYGLSEVGILRSKSRSSDSLWVKVGGEGFETRVVDGKLEIKAESAMLGYLNAPSPFTEDGWFITGDAVEVDGDFIKILGRESEIINIGGEKVYPAEVESALQMMDGVEDAVVTGQPHPLTGQIIFARVKLSTGESLQEFRARMREFCRENLPKYKIPQKIEIVESAMHGDRFKKMR